MTDKQQKTSRPLIMGVVNITPDSFSDGGDFTSVKSALAHVDHLLESGADIIDIGAESTRPGASPVAVQEEWKRLFPVLDQLYASRTGIKYSIDTSKPEIMRRALDFGVTMINNIAGLTDKETLQYLATHGAKYVCMHIKGEPQTMQHSPLKGFQVESELDNFVQESLVQLKAAGFKEDQYYFDPGIGFGKTDAANLRALKWSLSYGAKVPLLLGISRKGFIGRLFSDNDLPKNRDSLSKMLEMMLMMGNIKIIRTHEVKTLNRLRALMLNEYE